MGHIRFLFGIHNHQPVGNFDHVFEEAFQKAYLPFLQLLDKHPRIRISLHNSGCLWEWLEGHHPEYFHLIQILVDRGQVELLSGPFYEAILPAIPEIDRQGQIGMLSDYLEKQFGKRPRGAWLPERVWEPELARTFAEAGIEYTITDDWHFRAVGFEEKDLDGYYLTEDGGRAVAVFPISQKMRYLVPFHSVEESMSFFSQVATHPGFPAAILADDGEKFGIWPGTHKYCYQDGWLERFFTALEGAEAIDMVTFGEHLSQESPKGRAYLPTASYAELMEWALPAKAQRDYQDLLNRVQAGPSPDRFTSFIKGGFWRNFLSKYPEANHLHKRMLRASRKVRATSERGNTPLWQEAQRNLYRAQCNCAYWHGVFGGLYLPHLRSAVYSCLIAAESGLDRLHPEGARIMVEDTDFDVCGQREVVIETPKQNLYLFPSQGGSLLEWDLKAKAINLCDTLARREEGYHAGLRKAAENSPEEETRSIHERILTKEAGLERYLVYDRRRRGSLLDRFFLEGSLEEERRARLLDVGDFADRPYEVRSEAGLYQAEVFLWHEGSLNMPSGERKVRLEKALKVPKDGTKFEVEYSLSNKEATPLEVHFGIEFNFGMLAGDTRDRYYEFPGAALEDRRLVSEGEVECSPGFQVVDEWAKFKVVLSWSLPATVWRYPVETVSQSEAGFERLYQCSAILPHWNLSVKPGGSWDLHLRVGVEDL